MKNKGSKLWPLGERREMIAGVEMSCNEISPGRTLHELLQAFANGKAEAKPGDEFAGNPSKWPDVRGIIAVVESIRKGIEDGQNS